MSQPGKWGEGRRPGKVQQWRWALLAVAIAGCGEARPGPAPFVKDDFTLTGSSFEPTATGTIEGRVLWKGPLPQVDPFEVVPIVEGVGLVRQRTVQPNPNQPLVHEANNGVGNAVVFLRGVDPRRARPWDLPPVTVEIKGQRLQVVQDRLPGPFGFVRRGDKVELVSRDRAFHGIRGGGANFFSLLFPAPHEPLWRTMAEAGVVDLTSAAGAIWMRAYLFVDDHPYYTRTNARGRFRLDRVPPGDYELVAWMPNWHVVRQERDPESCQVVRVTFGPAGEVKQAVTVQSQENKEINFCMSLALFQP